MSADPIASTGIPQANAATSGGNAATTKNSNPNGKTPSGVVIPDEAKKKYPDLAELILKSESMNTEEQNYWLQVLPVMTPDQIAELRDILETEKRKLAAIDAKYAAQKGGMGPGAPKTGTKLTKEELEAVEKKRKEAQEERREEEKKHRAGDEEKAEELLARLDEL